MQSSLDNTELDFVKSPLKGYTEFCTASGFSLNKKSLSIFKSITPFADKELTDKVEPSPICQKVSWKTRLPKI